MVSTLVGVKTRQFTKHILPRKVDNVDSPRTSLNPERVPQNLFEIHLAFLYNMML